MPDFLDIRDVANIQLRKIISSGRKIKEQRGDRYRGTIDEDAALTGIVAALIFEKPSTRTRLSFDVGVKQLGGQSIILATEALQLSHGESIQDTAAMLSRYVDIIMIRTFDRAILCELAHYAEIPVINGLTNNSHPCQIMADVMTFEEHKGSIKNKQVTWLGAGNNVCTSFLEAAGKFGFNYTFCGPHGFEPDTNAVDFARATGVQVAIEPDPIIAVKYADLLVTDAWLSMHENSHDNHEEKIIFEKYQVNSELLAHCKSDVLFMHCLPAHREEEVTSEVLDGPNSVVLDEAENRLHVQKAILRWCLNRL